MSAVVATHSLEFIAGHEWSQAKEKKYARERDETREEPREENRKENELSVSDGTVIVRPLSFCRLFSLFSMPIHLFTSEEDQ